jgi:transcriptional regulator NrdR family protein
MKCPICNHRVYVREMVNRNQETKRTYECPNCMTRFQTKETFTKFFFKGKTVDSAQTE